MRLVDKPEMIDGIKVAKNYDEVVMALTNGESVMHYEFGDSMSPLINSGEYAKIVPCVPIDVQRGDAVFCKMRTEQGDYYMVHQVWEISNCGHDHRRWFKIGSTGTTIFGWTCEVLGKAYGTDIYQEITQEMRDEWEAERLERIRAFEAAQNP